MYNQSDRQPIGAALRTAGAIALLATATACGSVPPRIAAAPDAHVTEAKIPGIEGARVYVRSDTKSFEKIGLDAFAREKAAFASTGDGGALPPANYLAISGGGDNGAFGVGLLSGWKAAGNRPQFKLVTGVSTGALIAPFAFLGGEYDKRLSDLYTSIGPDDIYEERGLLTGLFSDGLADNSPLFRLVAKHANQDMLDAIAVEHEKGRILLVGTTNLDAQQPVIWNIGAIAASDAPGRLALFHRILVASAAIPGAFPPVMIDVEYDGKPFQEMHVDGGTSAQAFVYPTSLNVGQISRSMGVTRERNLYIIRNARLDADWASVERSTVDVIGRAIASLINSQGVGDLYRMYTQAEKDGVSYNLAFIKPDFTERHKEEFDTEFMRKLYDYGFENAKNGYLWQKYPPGFTPGS